MTASKLIGALFAATILSAPAWAQTYPERQITMVVPFSAGGPTDTVARLVAERMSADLGQQIVVQNVGGAGGTLGAGQVDGGEAGLGHDRPHVVAGEGDRLVGVQRPAHRRGRMRVAKVPDALLQRGVRRQ